MFDVPFVGSVVAMYLSALLFIAANLTVGITLSSLAQNQLQAMQLTFFYFLPNILLSGFMFPFQGMPDWAQAIGSVLPLDLLQCGWCAASCSRATTGRDLWPSIWPMMVFTAGRDDASR